MARVATPTRKVDTAEEYLRLEDLAKDRHEFVDGWMFLMAGGTVQHSQIALRLASKLLEATEGTDCEVVNSDVKLQIEDVYYYPDVMLSCQEDRLERRLFRQPCAVFEVLSESTEPIDRGEKLLRYRTIPSLKIYVLLAQDTARAEVYRRLDVDDGSWRYDVLEGDAVLEVPYVDLKVIVSSLYRGVL
jgi:Uma2 family endonuclease